MKESRLWIAHLFAGFCLIFLLLSHILLMHYSELLNVIGIDVQNVLSFNEVIKRAKSAGFKIIYILFLIFALYHGLYGLRNILIETPFGEKFSKPIGIILLTIGVLFFIYGGITTIFIKF